MEPPFSLPVRNMKKLHFLLFPKKFSLGQKILRTLHVWVLRIQSENFIGHTERIIFIFPLLKNTFFGLYNGQRFKK